MVSINIKHIPTLWPRNPFLVIYAREKDLLKNVLAFLFIIVKNWKRPKFPPTEEHINKCYIFIQGNSTQFLKKKLLIDTTAWIKPKNIMLSKSSQTQRVHIV